MIEADKAGLFIELQSGETKCHLNKCDNTADNYIVQKIGDKDNSYEIVVPICTECAQSIQSGEWVLLYCIRCNESQWVNKELSNRDYDKKSSPWMTNDGIVWMNECPKCSMGD